MWTVGKQGKVQRPVWSVENCPPKQRVKRQWAARSPKGELKWQQLVTSFRIIHGGMDCKGGVCRVPG